MKLRGDLGLLCTAYNAKLSSMDDFGAWPSLQSLLSEVCQHRRVTLAAWHGHRATQAPQNSCVPSATSFRLIWCYCFIDRRDIWHCFLGPLTSYPYSKIHEHCIYNYPSYIVELTLRSGRWYRSYRYSRPDDYDGPSDVHRTKMRRFHHSWRTAAIWYPKTPIAQVLHLGAPGGKGDNQRERLICPGAD